ncbi:MAG TPA: cysteine peptidase family C39 domain-containing protein, partial [Verrucomicrobiae bacterium]
AAEWREDLFGLAFAVLVVYAATVLVIIAGATLAGWLLGRRHSPHAGKHSFLKTILLLVGVVGWYVVANWARHYSDTDGFGAAVAEWFGFSGKWYFLLAAMMAGHGWIIGSRQAPGGSRQRILYLLAVLGMATLVVGKTIPIYFLLDAGQRDADGFLRESDRVEVTCGAVALLNYLERYRHCPPLTEREVSRACHVTMEGATPTALVRAAHYFGVTNVTARVLTPAQLDMMRLPAIVSISTVPGMHHATLLIHLDADHADFIDPAYGRWRTTRERFQQIWYGRTVLLE